MGFIKFMLFIKYVNKIVQLFIRFKLIKRKILNESKIIG
jgi:hypothetical protein